MSCRKFRLHANEEATFGLAPCTNGGLLAVALARIMGPTTDEKARQLANKWGGEFEFDGKARILIKDGERHELPRLPTWTAVWAQIAPHILEGVGHEDVDPTRLCTSEVARAYLHWHWSTPTDEEFSALPSAGAVEKMSPETLRGIV